LHQEREKKTFWYKLILPPLVFDSLPSTFGDLISHAFNAHQNRKKPISQGHLIKVPLEEYSRATKNKVTNAENILACSLLLDDL